MSPFSGDNEDILYKSILHDKVQYTSKMDRESKSFCEKVINFKLIYLIFCIFNSDQLSQFPGFRRLRDDFVKIHFFRKVPFLETSSENSILVLTRSFTN